MVVTSEKSIRCNIAQHIKFGKVTSTYLPSANEVAERLWFYTCLSFCPQGGVCPSACCDTPPPGQTPPGSRDPLPLGSRHPPRESRHQPPSVADTPKQTATVADGTHSTGMHSCVIYATKTDNNRRPFCLLVVNPIFVESKPNPQTQS